MPKENGRRGRLPRGHDEIQRRTLLRVERQRLRRQHAPPRQRIAPLLPGRHRDDTLLRQRPQRRRRRLQLPAELLHPAAAQPHDLLVQPLLVLRESIRRRGGGNGLHEHLLLRAHPRLQHCRRNRRVQHRFERRCRVGRDLRHQLQKRRRKERRLIHDRLHRLENNPLPDTLPDEFHREASRFAVPERNKKKLADGQLLLELFRYLVGEQPVER